MSPCVCSICVLSVLNKHMFMFMFSDSGQSCGASSKGERLSARLRAFPAANEPYESSSNKEIGKCPRPRSPRAQRGRVPGPEHPVRGGAVRDPGERSCPP